MLPLRNVQSNRQGGKHVCAYNFKEAVKKKITELFVFVTWIGHTEIGLVRQKIIKEKKRLCLIEFTGLDSKEEVKFELKIGCDQKSKPSEIDCGKMELHKQKCGRGH